MPTRLVAGLLILKHMHNLSDEALCDRWVENPYFQYFCGETVFQHEVPFDRSSLTRWRQPPGSSLVGGPKRRATLAELVMAALSESVDWQPARRARPRRAQRSLAVKCFIVIESCDADDCR